MTVSNGPPFQLLYGFFGSALCKKIFVPTTTLPFSLVSLGNAAVPIAITMSGFCPTNILGRCSIFLLELDWYSSPSGRCSKKSDMHHTSTAIFESVKAARGTGHVLSTSGLVLSGRRRGWFKKLGHPKSDVE